MKGRWYLLVGIVGSVAVVCFLGWYWSDAPWNITRSEINTPSVSQAVEYEPITDDVVLNVRRSIRQLVKANVENGKWTKKSDCRTKPMGMTTMLLIKFAVAEYEEACPKAVDERNAYLRDAREARRLFALEADSPELETTIAKRLMSRFRALKPIPD